MTDVILSLTTRLISRYVLYLLASFCQRQRDKVTEIPRNFPPPLSLQAWAWLRYAPLWIVVAIGPPKCHSLGVSVSIRHLIPTLRHSSLQIPLNLSSNSFSGKIQTPPRKISLPGNLKIHNLFFNVFCSFSSNFLVFIP